VSTRLNIPWLSREKANATLPSFLKDDRSLSGGELRSHGKEKVRDDKNKKKKITKLEKQKLFMQLKTGMLSSIEEK